jgi:hypothetical protein
MKQQASPVSPLRSGLSSSFAQRIERRFAPRAENATKPSNRLNGVDSRLRTSGRARGNVPAHEIEEVSRICGAEKESVLCARSSLAAFALILELSQLADVDEHLQTTRGQQQ